MTTPNAIVSSVAVAAEPTYAELKARLDVLERKARFAGSKLKVTAKGGVSHYCLGRFPVTLTEKQWRIVLKTVKSGELEQFLADHSAELYKGE